MKGLGLRVSASGLPPFVPQFRVQGSGDSPRFVPDEDDPSGLAVSESMEAQGQADTDA